VARLPSPSSVRVWATSALLTVIVVTSFMSAVTLSGALVADDAGTTPKMYHAALLIAGAVMLFRGRIVRPRAELLLYFGVTIGTSLLAYGVHEPRVAVLKLVVAFSVAFVAASVGRAAGPAVVLRACRIGSVMFLVAVTAKNTQHVPAFVAFLVSPLGHPDVPSLAGGGLNLEATWLALASIFLIGTTLFVPYVLAAAATSALYASRAGVVIAAMAVVAALFHAWGGVQLRRAGLSAAAPPRLRRRLAGVAIALAALGALGAGNAVVRQYGNAAYVAQRFAAIGGEPGSMGRLTLWEGGLHVFAEYPLGVGVGNAVPMLRRVLGVDVPEDNLHNIYLQHAVETGVPGLVALLIFAAMMAWRTIATRFRDHVLLFACGYLVAGAIQFTGVDAIFWLAYGLHWGTSGGGEHG
jgi:O-antigen ligase